MTKRKINAAKGEADAADGARGAIAAAEADGVEWTQQNTEPCVKVFRVELRLDIAGRIKLGLLAARCGVPPDRWLETFLAGQFSSHADAVFSGIGGRRDERLARQYEALFLAALSQVVKVGGVRVWRFALPQWRRGWKPARLVLLQVLLQVWRPSPPMSRNAVTLTQGGGVFFRPAFPFRQKKALLPPRPLSMRL